MHSLEIFSSMFYVFCGAAVLGAITLYTRQSLLIAYILCGIILGPAGFGFVNNNDFIMDISHIGVMFLLFLLGLDLHAKHLFSSLKQALPATATSALIFFSAGFFISTVLGLKTPDSLIVGCCMMFSSTIIGLKLLPNVALLHQKIGGIIVSILLLQDILAICLLLMLQTIDVNLSLVQKHFDYTQLMITVFGLPFLVIMPFIVQKYLLNPILERFKEVNEYIFLLAIAWCLGVGHLAALMGFSAEIGAFVAGISMAQTSLSTFIAARLKPLKDFFLILFFFAIGASFQSSQLMDAILPSILLFSIFFALKPFIFYSLLSETLGSKLSVQVGLRIGQLSEFSLLLAYLAYEKNFIQLQTSVIIQLTTVLSFFASSILISAKFPNPEIYPEKPKN